MYLKRLKEIRNKNNLSQEEVAKILEIDRSTYTSFEMGRDTIPLRRLNMFINYFKTSFDYIFELSDIYNYNNSEVELKNEIIAERLKSIRKECCYTQENVADSLNTNHSVWCRYEKGQYLITTSFLYAFCKMTNASSDYLLGRVDMPKFRG